MKHYISGIKCILFVFTIIFSAGCSKSEMKSSKERVLTKTDDTTLSYTLSTPDNKGNISVEEALYNRRSRRDFQDKEISEKQLSQILWACYGITSPRAENSAMRGGLRTAPSAGALYPLEIYVLVGKVKNIKPGIYKYIAKNHKIVMTINRDLRKELCAAALNQEMISKAPAVLFYSAIYNRCTERYGNRGRERYVCMDLGHSAQNVYLQVEALHLGTCAIGAFNDDSVKKTMQLSSDEEPLYIMPIGYYLNKP